MKRIMLLLLGLAVLALSGVAGAPVLAANDDAYIVVYKDSITGDGNAKTTQLEFSHAFAADQRYGSALKGFAARLNARQLENLRADPDVDFVGRDGIVWADGMVSLTPGDSVPTGVRRIGAGTTTDVHQASDVSVAVIDTGVDLTHPDLNAVNGKNCVRTRNTANDDNGHGSHVAGTIAAKNNGSGVAGVAPGTKVYAVKVLNAQGSGTWSQVICGIDWVAANAAAFNIKVANMSLGGGGANDGNCGKTNNDAMHKAICNATGKGVTFVVAAGNSAANLTTSVPAAYPEVLTVSAVSDSDGAAGGTGGAPTCRTGEADDKYATFSNYAVASTEQAHVVAAPGVCIKSTWKKGAYNTISGTSMATPHVTGVVALCLGNGGSAGACSGKAPAQIIQQIRSDAQSHASASNGFAGDPSHAVSGKYFGYMVYAGGY